MPLTSGHFKLPLILSTVNEMILSKDGASTDNGCYYIFIHHFTFCSLLGRNSYKSLFTDVRGEVGTERTLTGTFSGQRNRDRTAGGGVNRTWCAGRLCL